MKKKVKKAPQKVRTPEEKKKIFGTIKKLNTPESTYSVYALSACGTYNAYYGVSGSSDCPCPYGTTEYC